MATKPKPQPKDFVKEMKGAGFSEDAAQQQNDFWARMGISAVRMGKTKLVIQPKKKP